ncbi:uncharacterized protein LOC144636381 [Oculina patagonica]
MEEVIQAISICLIVVDFLLNTSRVPKAIELLKECLIILDNIAVMKEVFEKLTKIIFFKMFEAYCLVNDYTSALKYGRKLLDIYHKRGEKVIESRLSLKLANLCQEQSKYLEAKELCEKALAINAEIGDREVEASAYGKLGNVFQYLGEYVKAKDYLERAIDITKTVGDRGQEASCYVMLGNVFYAVGENYKAKEHMEKALLIMNEIGDKRGEASCYGNLGVLYLTFGEYLKSVAHLKKALAMRIKIGDRKGEATDNGNLGNVFYSLGEYGKAKIYLEKAIAIKKEIGYSIGEAEVYGTLGKVFLGLSEYVKGKAYHEKELAISQASGDRNGEATAYGNLGAAFTYLGEYVKAEEHLKNALAINKKIGDRNGEGIVYGNLGVVFLFLGKYATAKDYFEKALAINKETGYRKGEAGTYGNLGHVFFAIGDYVKAEEYYEKALVIRKEIGDKEGEALDYGNLGDVFMSTGEYVKTEAYLEKALALNQETGNVENQSASLCRLAKLKFFQGITQEAFSYLHSSIRKCEEMRGFLGDNDQFKINFSEGHVFPYWMLSAMFCASRNPNEALFVAELGRARALADLMSAQYSVKNQVSGNPQSRADIEQIMKKESRCTCLYISYSFEDLLLWVLNRSGVMHFRQMKINDNTASRVLQQVRSLNDFFAENFRRFGILSEEHCEDRSLHDNQLKSTQKGSPASFRIVEEEEENKNPEPNISLYYKMVIAPVADLLEEPEIIIVPDRSLYKVPFAALPDKRGKFLSETFRIRIIPSLTTLKLIQDSPADYHSQTGALIVGDPDVGLVRYKGKKKNISRLPCAGNEAAMIGRLLGVQPLLGEQATKQVVLDRINSVSLVHFAAHGDAERGEIALSPPRPITKIPVEEEYLLTMADISRVQLRAKLVVLSCCHSGQGETKVEGVVGIARAFLGSGARSVLVALWALEDSATEQLMNNFYGHLVRGESASESLHEAMKWMRANGYNHVRQWAPFMLIGDNVTFDFGK